VSRKNENLYHAMGLVRKKTKDSLSVKLLTRLKFHWGHFGAKTN